MEIESKSRQRHLLSSWAYSRRTSPASLSKPRRQSAPLHERPPTIFLSARTNLLQVRFIVNCLGAHQLPVIRHPLQPYPGCTSEVWPRWKEGLLSRSYLRSDRAIFLTGPLAPSPWPHRSRQIRRCGVRGAHQGATRPVHCVPCLVRPPQVPHRPAAPTTFSETLIARVQLHVSRIGIPPRLISNFFSLLSFFRRNCFLLSSFLLAEDVRVDFFFFCFRFILDVEFFINRRWVRYSIYIIIFFHLHHVRAT